MRTHMDIFQHRIFCLPTSASWSNRCYTPHELIECRQAIFNDLPAGPLRLSSLTQHISSAKCAMANFAVAHGSTCDNPT
eukprot:103677-Ditylum_brightwellii.AAC.1